MGGRSIPIKILIFAISLVILVSWSWGIYFLVTFTTHRHCVVCTENDGQFSIIGPFIWWSNWAFVATSITWADYVLKVIKNINPKDSLVLIELSLPLSIFVMVGYTLYLYLSGWGDDLVNQETCYRLADLYISREGTTVTQRNLHMGFGLLTTTCMHYICAIINSGLYFKYYVISTWRPYFTIGFVSVLSIIVVLSQEVGHYLIYCTNNIYIPAGLAILMCTILHALFFFRPCVIKQGGKEVLDHDTLG